MKIRDVSAPLLLFLFPAFSIALTNPTSANQPSADSIIAPRDVTNANTKLPDTNALAEPKVPPKKVLDAPVDGQDGRPHAGPWVETNADRDRKKLGKEDVSGDNEVYPSVLGRLGSDGMPLPHTNDGVMNDPDRSGPKEGTRGTEGGVSEKQKENQLSGGKVPDGPKEAPPLPQSEHQKLPPDSHTGEKEGKASESANNLGVLEVVIARLSIR